MFASKPIVLSPDALTNFTDTVNNRAKQLSSGDSGINFDAPDVPQYLMDQILELADKPRTTLNTHRMNKLLKKAGLESSFGQHKGKL